MNKKHELNQYEAIFEIGDDKCIIIDLSMGNYRIYGKSQEFLQVNDEKLEMKLKEGIKKIKKATKSDLLNVVLIPSFMCNMQCVYCYEGNNRIENLALKESDIDDIIHEIKKTCSKNNMMFVNFELLGGEPFIKPHVDWFEKFFESFALSGIEYDVSCTTNGLEIKNFLSFIIKQRIKSMQITLDGGKDIHNSRRVSPYYLDTFSKIIENIDLLLSMNIDIFLRMNIDESNVQDIYEVYKLVDERWEKKVHFYIYPISHNGLNEEESYLAEADILKLILNQFLIHQEMFNSVRLDIHGIEFMNNVLNKRVFIPKMRFCAACNNQLVFDGNKKIYTCWWGAGYDKMSIGSLAKGIQGIDLWLNRSIENIEKCNACKYKFICGGGCAFNSFRKNGTIVEGYCADFEAIFKVYFDFLSKMNLLPTESA